MKETITFNIDYLAHSLMKNFFHSTTICINSREKPAACQQLRVNGRVAQNPQSGIYLTDGAIR